MNQTSIHWDYLSDENKDLFSQVKQRSELIIRDYLAENASGPIPEIFNNLMILMIVGMSAEYSGYFTRSGYLEFLKLLKKQDGLLDQFVRNAVLKVANQLSTVEEVES